MKYQDINLVFRSYDKTYDLVLNGISIHLDDLRFARLARKFAKYSGAVEKQLEPPYVVVLEVQYETDADQQTPKYVEAWSFDKYELAAEFLKHASDYSGQFALAWQFLVSMPAIPELLVTHWYEYDNIGHALYDFLCTCFEDLNSEVGTEFWNKLPVEDRKQMRFYWDSWEMWPDQAYDKEQIERWVAGGNLGE